MFRLIHEPYIFDACLYGERRMWPVHVEGATSYSITFDPWTKTEANHDYVRFLKVCLLIQQLSILFFHLCVGFRQPQHTKEACQHSERLASFRGISFALHAQIPAYSGDFNTYDGFCRDQLQSPPFVGSLKTPVFVSVCHCVHIYRIWLSTYPTYHTYLAAVAEICSRNFRHYRSWPDARVAPSLLDVFYENLPWYFLISIEQYCRTAPTRRAPTSGKTATRVVGAAPNQTGRGWGEGLL